MKAFRSKELTDHNHGLPHILSGACDIEMISYSQGGAVDLKDSMPLSMSTDSYLPIEITNVIKRQYLECGCPLSNGDIMFIRFLGKKYTHRERH